MPERPKTVLLVEDNDADALLVGYYLRQHAPAAYRLVRAASLDAAKETLNATRPDLIVLDLGLPGFMGSMTVLALLDMLPSTERLPPIVVLTNADEAEAACRAGGTTGFCTKGKMVESPRDFVKLLQKCLATWEYQQALIETTGSPHAPCANFVPTAALSLPTEAETHGQHADALHDNPQ